VAVVTLLAALLAALISAFDAYSKKVSSDKSAEAATKAANAAAESSAAAKEAVLLNERTADAIASQTRADFFFRRYHEATAQLGHTDSAVRLAGVHAIALLADDWDEQRQMCIDVLTSYLQVPYQADESHHAFRHGERETRRNILRVIRNHLRLGYSSVSWCGYNFRFEGAVFDGGDLSGAHITGGHMTFHGAEFVGTSTFHFNGLLINGGNVYFTEVEFKSGTVDFSGTVFESGYLTFENANETGGIALVDHVRHDGGTLKKGPFVGRLP
jgi:type II secretory pathway pseudopilin PulG